MRRGRAIAAAIAIAAVGGAAGWLASADPKGTLAWEVTAPARVEVAVGAGAGASATFELEIVPGENRSVSRDGPVRVDVRVPDGLSVSRRRFGLGDAVDPGARAPRFAVKLTAARAGTYEVEVGVRLWLCLRQTCKPVKATRTVVVEAVAPAVPDAAPAPVDAAAKPDARPKRRPR